jgi:hypothetical protein
MLFAFATFFGLATTLVRLFVTRRLSKYLAFVHVPIATAGLLLLAFAAAWYGLPPLGLVSLGLFTVAALAGVRIFVEFHLRNKSLSIWLSLGHGVVAIAAQVLLWTAGFQFETTHRHLRSAPQAKPAAGRVTTKYEARARLKCRSRDDWVGPGNSCGRG